jgi:hypothetical protein
MLAVLVGVKRGREEKGGRKGGDTKRVQLVGVG